MKLVWCLPVLLFGLVSSDKYLDCGPNWKQNFCRIRNTTEANANELLHFSQYPKKNLSLVEKIVFDKDTVNQMTKTLLENLPNLEEIRAKNCDLTQIDKDLFGTNQGKKLKELKTLTLSKNSLTKLEDMMFARASELEALYLVRNKIATIEKNAFRGLKKLSTLDLSHNYLKKLTHADMFPDSEQMYRLDFSHNHLQEVDFEVFANNQRYQAIKLNNNNIDKVRASEDNFNIGVLDLSFNSLMNATALGRMKNLISFKADHNYNASLVSTVNFIEEAIAMQSLRYYNIFTQVPFNRRAETPETETCVTPALETSLARDVADPEMMPWLAGLYTKHTKKPKFKCDASLISAKVAISSASCAYNGRIMIRPKKLLLQLGRSNTDPTQMLTQNVKKLIVHPDFNTNEVNVPEPDILLAVMKKPITFSPTVRSICMTPLRSSVENLVGRSGVLVGWQRSSIDLLAKAVPRMNQVPVSPSKRCMNGFEADDKFCSTKMDSAVSCDVAPGTGLVIKGKRDWKLRAIVSMALYDSKTKQCNTNSRFVFTDLGQHSDWIESMVKKQNSLPLISDLTLDTSLDDFDFPFF